MDIKSFTLRLPGDLYRQVKARKRRSISEYVLEAVREKVARDREADISRGFASLAGSVEEDEHRLWSEAQNEAMAHVDD